MFRRKFTRQGVYVDHPIPLPPPPSTVDGGGGGGGGIEYWLIKVHGRGILKCIQLNIRFRLC